MNRNFLLHTVWDTQVETAQYYIKVSTNGFFGEIIDPFQVHDYSQLNCPWKLDEYG